MSRHSIFNEKVILTMSLISMLLGCKTTSLKGPDFVESIPKVLHVKPYYTVTYEMPGNMSNLMGFGTRYLIESPRTFVFDTSTANEFSRFDWRRSFDLDGAMWEYNVRNRGSLNLGIEILKTSESKTLKEFLRESYEKFYNGENGLNTELRAARPTHSEEDFGGKLRVVPSEYTPISLNQAEAIRWQEVDKIAGYEVTYYAIQIDPSHTLLFSFRYSMSVLKESDIPKLQDKIRSDIDEYMSHVEITQIGSAPINKI